MDVPQADILKYKHLYLQTARSYLNDMQRNIDLLFKEPENSDAIDIVHLAAHSLASQSLVMGYPFIGNYSRLVEKIFKQKQEQTLTLSSGIISSIDIGLKKIALSLYEIEKKNPELNLSIETELLEKESRLKTDIV